MFEYTDKLQVFDYPQQETDKLQQALTHHMSKVSNSIN